MSTLVIIGIAFASFAAYAIIGGISYELFKARNVFAPEVPAAIWPFSVPSYFCAMFGRWLVTSAGEAMDRRAERKASAMKDVRTAEEKRQSDAVKEPPYR